MITTLRSIRRSWIVAVAIGVFWATATSASATAGGKDVSAAAMSMAMNRVVERESALERAFVRAGREPAATGPRE